MGRRWHDGQGTLEMTPGDGGDADDLDHPDRTDRTDHPDRADPPGRSGRSGRSDRPGSLVPLEIASSYRARTRGLLGRDGIDGAILLTPASSVHTFRMRFAIDVAYLDSELRVLHVHTMRPGRLGAPRLRARHVLEAEAGAMAGWGLRKGVRVTVSVRDDR